MIRYYFKIALANIRQSKVYSFISISSLTVGMAISILLLIYVSDELSFDRFHDKSDNIYRLCHEDHPYQAPQTAQILLDQLPEIVNGARILPRNNITVQIGDHRFIEMEVAFADAELFNIFSFNFNKGQAEAALVQPGAIVISEKIAEKYFGEKNPMGEILRLENERDYTITGVIENIPTNSHFRYDFFVTLSDANEVYGKELMNNFGWENFLVYFEIQDEFSVPDLEAKIDNLLDRNDDPDDPQVKYHIQELKDIHLHSAHFNNDIQPQNSITYVLIFSAIGLLILLIACFNYINLLTANATTRVTEIGVRKSFGASRSQLSKQFICESVTILLISTVLALILVKTILPIFNELSGKDLSMLILLDRNNILGILGMMLIVSLISGWYPAFILSSFKPMKVLKASSHSGGSKIQFKKILIGAQFTIVIALIACSMIMLRQINFLEHKELGFDKESVLVAEFNLGNQERYNTVKQALLAQSIVSKVSAASRVPSDDLSNYGGVLPEGQTEWHGIPFVHVNFDYFDLLGIKAKQGRVFSSEIKSDSTESVILNEAALKELGIQGDPIGQRLQCSWPRSERTIVGVINDVNFESLYGNVRPTLFVIHYDNCYLLMVKASSSAAVNTVDVITKTCYDIYPDEIIDFHYLDVKLEQLYKKDKNTFHLMSYFTIVAILLSCMGLLGMVSFILVRRTKEIGIRKVNGATIFEIMQMLNLSFVKWMVISFVIAVPVAYFVMNRWLESFAYKTALSWWLFALTGVISLVIVLTTVSWMTYNAARRNPIKSLRYE